MKTLKKVLCTTLAAVSLSAFVAVPSSLNNPNSDNTIVNVIVADAKEQTPIMLVRVTEGEQYYLRSGPRFGSNVIESDTIKKGTVLKIYKISKDERWYRVTQDSIKPEKWIYAARTHRIGTDYNNKPYHDRIQHYKKHSVKAGKTQKVDLPIGAAMNLLMGQVGLGDIIPLLKNHYITCKVTPMEERCSDCGYTIRKYDKWEV